LDRDRVAGGERPLGRVQPDQGGGHPGPARAGLPRQPPSQAGAGFFLDVSNYQPTPELIDYGTWISDCIAMVTDPDNAFFNNPSACASQYYPATQSDFSTWGLTTAWYAQNM